VAVLLDDLKSVVKGRPPSRLPRALGFIVNMYLIQSTPLAEKHCPNIGSWDPAYQAVLNAYLKDMLGLNGIRALRTPEGIR
jgi:hypothetical protein